MIDYFLSPFLDNEFMRLALLAGLVTAVICAVAGTFIVLRGLAFIGDALAHGVLPGIAAATLLGVSTIVGAAVGAAVLVGGVGLITKRTRLSSDTAIGLLFVGMLALGVIMTSRSASFAGDLTRILFGELLGANESQLMWMTMATLVVGAVTYVCRRPFMLLCISRDLARANGFNASLFEALMMSVIGVAILASFQSVGTLLVFGLLIAPPSTAALVTRRLHTMIVVASVSGVIATYIGLLVSFHHDLAAGASVVVSATAIFVLVFVVSTVRHRRVSDGHPAVSHTGGHHHAH
ncbi:MAG: hypothetical protein RL419_1316 [Actinomycetota bacterium]|jgi:ABC-type Mn2+/Zn2+ transport system permease subunit